MAEDKSKNDAPSTPAIVTPKSAAGVPAAPAKRERKFEVVRTLNLGAKHGIREPGDEVTAGELQKADDASKRDAGATERELIEAGHIRDADAPLPPSQAEGVAAFDRLASVAQRIGILKREGAQYRLGDKTAKGLAAFRAAVSTADLENAIVKAFEG